MIEKNYLQPSAHKTNNKKGKTVVVSHSSDAIQSLVVTFRIQKDDEIGYIS